MVEKIEMASRIQEQEKEAEKEEQAKPDVPEGKIVMVVSTTDALEGLRKRLGVYDGLGFDTSPIMKKINRMEEKLVKQVSGSKDGEVDVVPCELWGHTALPIRHHNLRC